METRWRPAGLTFQAAASWALPRPPGVAGGDPASPAPRPSVQGSLGCGQGWAESRAGAVVPRGSPVGVAASGNWLWAPWGALDAARRGLGAGLGAQDGGRRASLLASLGARRRGPGSPERWESGWEAWAGRWGWGAGGWAAASWLEGGTALVARLGQCQGWVTASRRRPHGCGGHPAPPPAGHSAPAWGPRAERGRPDTAPPCSLPQCPSSRRGHPPGWAPARHTLQVGDLNRGTEGAVSSASPCVCPRVNVARGARGQVTVTRSLNIYGGAQGRGVGAGWDP